MKLYLDICICIPAEHGRARCSPHCPCMSGCYKSSCTGYVEGHKRACSMHSLHIPGHIECSQLVSYVVCLNTQRLALFVLLAMADCARPESIRLHAKRGRLGRSKQTNSLSNSFLDINNAVCLHLHVQHYGRPVVFQSRFLETRSASRCARVPHHPSRVAPACPPQGIRSH